MKFASIRVVTDDFERLVEFYERLSGVEATIRAAGLFAEVRMDGCILAISSREIIDQVNGGAIVPNANRSLMLEFETADVDAMRALANEIGEIVQEPTTMPWGNRSMLVRDPDGAIINIFSRPRP